MSQNAMPYSLIRYLILQIGKQLTLPPERPKFSGTMQWLWRNSTAACYSADLLPSERRREHRHGGDGHGTPAGHEGGDRRLCPQDPLHVGGSPPAPPHRLRAPSDAAVLWHQRGQFTPFIPPPSPPALLSPPPQYTLPAQSPPLLSPHPSPPSPPPPPPHPQYTPPQCTPPILFTPQFTPPIHLPPAPLPPIQFTPIQLTPSVHPCSPSPSALHHPSTPPPPPSPPAWFTPPPLSIHPSPPPLAHSPLSRLLFGLSSLRCSEAPPGERYKNTQRLFARPEYRKESEYKNISVLPMVSFSQVFFYSKSIFTGAGVSKMNIPYAVIGTNAVNVAMTIITVSMKTASHQQAGLQPGRGHNS